MRVVTLSSMWSLIVPSVIVRPMNRSLNISGPFCLLSLSCGWFYSCTFDVLHIFVVGVFVVFGCYLRGE